MEKALKDIAKNYGIYLGLVLMCLTVLAYFVSLDLFVNPWFGISIYVMSIFFGFISVVKTKDYFEGYLSFKYAFTAYFVVILIGLVIYTVTSVILFNVVDPEASNILQEKSIEKITEIYSRMDIPEAEIEKMVRVMKSQDLYSLGNSITNLVVTYLLPLSVIGLLVAAALKKNKPE